MPKQQIQMPTNKELVERAIKVFRDKGFTEKEIISVVTENYVATPSGIRNTLRRLEEK